MTNTHRHHFIKYIHHTQQQSKSLLLNYTNPTLYLLPTKSWVVCASWKLPNKRVVCMNAISVLNKVTHTPLEPPPPSLSLPLFPLPPPYLSFPSLSSPPSSPSLSSPLFPLTPQMYLQYSVCCSLGGQLGGEVSHLPPQQLNLLLSSSEARLTRAGPAR